MVARFGLIALLLLTGGLLPEDRIPDFELENLDGEHVALHELQGEHLTVIDFWATWCGPCLEAIPALVELSEDFEGRGVRFVGVNVDSPRNLSKVKPFARSLGITYPVLLVVDSAVMARLDVTAMPTLFVVDAEREIVLVHEGYRPGDAAYLRDELERLLAEQPDEQ